MTQEKLNKILKDHNLWLKTGGEKGAKADQQPKEFVYLDYI